MIPVIRRAVPYDNEVEWKSIYIPQTRSAERLAVPKSKGNPVILKRIGSESCQACHIGLCEKSLVSTLFSVAVSRLRLRLARFPGRTDPKHAPACAVCHQSPNPAPAVVSSASVLQPRHVSSVRIGSPVSDSIESAGQSVPRLH